MVGTAAVGCGPVPAVTRPEFPGAVDTAGRTPRWVLRSLRTRAVIVCLALCATVLGGSVAWAPSAAAHAELIGTSPADGERLEEPPGQVVLEFTEGVQPVRDGIRLLDAEGAVVATPTPHVEGSTVTVAPPTDLPTGGYVVSWRVLSRDTHPVSGAFSFGVRAEAVEAASAESSTTVIGGSSAMSVLRWLGFAGLALLVGGAAFLLLCWPAGRALAPVRRLVWGGWALVAVSALLAVPAQGAHVSGTDLAVALSPTALADTLTSQFGLLHVTRLALLVLAAPVLHRLLRPEHRPRWALAGVGAVPAAGIAATFAGTGHSASGVWPAVAIISDTVHLTAVSLWVGGLVFLAVYALRPRHVDGLGGGLVRFSRLATAVVATLVVTGTFQAWRNVGSLDALGATAYGRVLLTKLALVAVVFGIGGLSMLAVRRAGVARLRHTVPVEVGVAAAVLAVTAILVVTPPARQIVAEPAGGPQTEVLTLPGGDSVRVELTPGVVGSNELQFFVTDPAGQPRTVAELTARASLPDRDVGPFEVDVVGHGSHFIGEVSLPFPDSWRFNVTVRSSELDAYVISTTMEVGAATRR